MTTAPNNQTVEPATAGAENACATGNSHGASAAADAAAGHQLSLPTIDDVIMSRVTEDAYNEAVNYMSRHRIQQLFQNLTSELVYSRPDDVIAFLLERIERRGHNSNVQLSGASRKTASDDAN